MSVLPADLAKNVGRQTDRQTGRQTGRQREKFSASQFVCDVLTKQPEIRSKKRREVMTYDTP